MDELDVYDQEIFIIKDKTVNIIESNNCFEI